MISALEKEVLQLIFQYNGSVYGGYVRDKLTNKPFKDMDVWLKTSSDFEHLVETIKQKFLKTEVESLNKVTQRYFRTNNHVKINIEHYDEKLDLDLVLVDRFEFMHHHNADVDINRFMLTKNGIQIYSTQKSFLDIFYNLNNNTFEKEDNCPEHRATKLKEKGWEDHPNIIIEDILK